MCHVVFFTEDLVIQLIICSLNNLFTNTAYLLGLLEILLTDRLVLEKEIRSFKRLIAHMTLHAARVIVSVVVHHTVPHNLLLANRALLLVRLVTFCTVSIVIFRKEFPIQLLLASMTSEAVLMEHFTKSCTAVIREVSLAVITRSCGFVHRFYCPVPNSCQHVRVAQILTDQTITREAFCGCSWGPDALIWRHPS